MQLAFKEPHVVVDEVALQVGLHGGDVVLQAEPGQGVVALLFGTAQVAVAVEVIELPGQLLDVGAVVAVLRELHGILTQDDLAVTGVQRGGKLVDLVARVVDVKLPGHLVARPGQDLRQAVAQHAAPGVAHVHGAGGVGGDELHHHLFGLVGPGAAVVGPFRGDVGEDVFKPAVAQAQVEEAGTRDLGGGKAGALQRHVGNQDLRRLAGRHAQKLCVLHGKAAGVIAVAQILGDLDLYRAHLCPRQVAGLRRGVIGLSDQAGGLGHCGLDMIH